MPQQRSPHSLIVCGSLICLVAFAATSCGKSDDIERSSLSQAETLFAVGQYDKAEAIYRELLRTNPEQATAVRRLALIYFAQGQLPKAYPLLKKASELTPADMQVQLRLGQARLTSREFELARVAALRVLDVEPGNEEAMLLLADTAVGPEHIDFTRKLVLDRRTQDQDRSAYHLALGALAMRQQNLANAEAEFTNARALNPNSAIATAALGTFYLNRNDMQAAGEAFKAAATLQDNDPRSPVLVRYADFLLATGHVTEARSLLDSVHQRVPDSLPPRVRLMKLACAEHRDEECRGRVEDILAQDPSNFDAIYQDGVLSLTRNDASRALRDFQSLSAVFRQNAQVQFHLAQAYLQQSGSVGALAAQNAFEQAERSLNDAIRIDPHFDAATLLLAQLKLKKGSPAAAIDLLLPLTRDRPQVTQSHHLLAAAHLAQGNGDAAVAALRRLSESVPQDPQPAYQIGALLFAPQPAAAREAFEKSLAIAPDFVPALEKLVDLGITEKQYAHASGRVQQGLERSPNSAALWTLRGKLYFAQQDLGQAEGALLKATELDAKFEPAQLLLAQLYFTSNRQEQAIARLAHYVGGNPSVTGLMVLASLNERLQRFAAAADAYSRLIASNPNFSPALNNLAFLEAEYLGNLDAAADLSKRARDINPGEPHIADTLGWISLKRGDYAAALHSLQESAGKLPEQPDIQFHLGLAYYMLGQDELARLAFERALNAKQAFPGQDEARRRLAVLTIDLGQDNSKAQAELESYLRSQPADPAALFRLAVLRERFGASEDARKIYERLLADDPFYGPAIRKLALVYSQQKDPKALELATRARQVYPDDPEIAQALGILNYQRGLLSQSVELLKEAAGKRTHDPELMYHLGRAYRELKQWQDCRSTLQQALKLNLPSTLADAAKQSLADCSETAPL